MFYPKLNPAILRVSLRILGCFGMLTAAADGVMLEKPGETKGTHQPISALFAFQCPCP